ncbi:MAG: pyruvate dehydrogenase E2 component (dihydrolipoamide acetyltransferase), partial [Paraglaciecola sp.]
MSDSQKILVPDVGGDEVEIIEICFAVGDSIEADEGIVTVETDKASMDIPAPFAGKLSALLVSVGDKIKEGDVIAEMTSSQAVPETAEATEETTDEAPAEAVEETVAEVESTPAPAEAPAKAAVSAQSEIIDIAVPDIGEDGEVEIIDVLVSVGDVIEVEDGLI